jgi:hypothetical protein
MVDPGSVHPPVGRHDADSAVRAERLLRLIEEHLAAIRQAQGGPAR